LSQTVLSRTLITTISVAILGLAHPAVAQIAGTQTAAGTNRPLNLDADSPFRDPDIIYLEADELINSEGTGILTARGEVEGRYQDRTLRAEKVVYNLNTGLVIASGNVVLIDANGSTQYADKLELSNELEAGTASNFTARFPEGGLTAAAFATRSSEEEIELYNAYYTACEPCVEDGKTDKPTWRIRARRVRQDKDTKSIRYRDAVFEFKGVPLFYTPYLSHPDPSAGRTSGFLNPFVGISGDKGFNFRTPYYWAIDDYSELTVTPRIYAKVNPLLELDYKRQFYTGAININTSVTYASFFDNNGDTFNDTDVFLQPGEAPLGKRLRSHFFADGIFAPTDILSYGFGVQLASDDLFLRRYDLDERPKTSGLYQADGRRLISQAFVVGQDDDFRASASTFGFQSLRTSIFRSETNPSEIRISREDDSILPIVAPKLEVSKIFEDPIVGGHLETYGDATFLTRKIGTNYNRASAGANWNKTFIAPAGVEVKPFANARFDTFDIEPEDQASVKFDRTVGQVGADIRWPFIKPGQDVDIIIEPRVQVTQSFGDGQNENFTAVNAANTPFSIQQDSLAIDLDQAQFWQSNKSTGFDFWQKGFRADVGASVTADWDKSRAHLFVGQSYASGFDDSFALGSGLAGDKSDIVAAFELNINDKIRSHTRIRYDDDDSKFRRIDTSLSYTGDRVKAGARYYKIDGATLANSPNPLAPPEEVSGGVEVRVAKNWSTRYRATHDIDRNVTRRQDLALIYDDQCTRIELLYTKNNNNLGIVGNNTGFGIRVALLTLGDFGGN